MGNNMERLDNAKSCMTLNVRTRILNFILLTVDAFKDLHFWDASL